MASIRRASAASPAARIGQPVVAPEDITARLDRIEARVAAIGEIVGAEVVSPRASAPPPTAVPAPEAAAEPAAALPDTAQSTVAGDVAGWRDELVFSLEPSEAKEIKLDMTAGDVATFEWTSTGGGVNYTQHGDDGGANEVRFEDGRASPGQEGTMTAPFSGKHGWFWRNRSDAPVTVTLRVGGAYAQMVEVKQP